MNLSMGIKFFSLVMIMANLVSSSCALNNMQQASIAGSVLRIPVAHAAAACTENGNDRAAAGLHALMALSRLCNHIEHAGHKDTLKIPFLYWGTRDGIAFLASLKKCINAGKKPLEVVDEEVLSVEENSNQSGIKEFFGNKHTHLGLMSLESAINIAQVLCLGDDYTLSHIRKEFIESDLMCAILYTLIREIDNAAQDSQAPFIKSVFKRSVVPVIIFYLEAFGKIDLVNSKVGDEGTGESQWGGFYEEEGGPRREWGGFPESEFAKKVREQKEGRVALGFDADSNPSKEQLRAAYKREVLKWHPDKNKDKLAEATAKMQALSNAKDALEF